MRIHGEEHMGYGKVAFVCGTPLQIIGAMSIATELEKDGAVCDVFLRHDFSGSSDAAIGLRDNGPFEKVFDVGYVSNGLWSIRGESDAINLEPPYDAVASASLLDQTGGQSDGKGYDAVFCSYPYDTGIYLMAANCGRAELHRYDDGIGSYLGDAMSMRGFVDTWLFRPDIAEGQIGSDCPVRKIPFGRDSIEMAGKVFGTCDVSGYRGKRIVLLTQPIDSFPGRRAVDSEIFDALEPYAESVIVRRHPRDDEPCDPRFEYDTVGSPWELLCALGAIPDDAILVGGCSTAQAMPHMIGSSHSIAVFTQAMYREAMESCGEGHEYSRGEEAVGVMERFLGEYAVRVDGTRELVEAIESK